MVLTKSVTVLLRYAGTLVNTLTGENIFWETIGNFFPENKIAPRLEAKGLYCKFATNSNSNCGIAFMLLGVANQVNPIVYMVLHASWSIEIGRFTKTNI